MEPKKLSLEEMEEIEGGGFMDGACKMLGFTAAGIGFRALVGVVAIPVWGQVALAVGGTACLAYHTFW